MATQEIAVRETGALIHQQFTEDQIDLIKRTICKGATDDELALFMHICRRTGLDPLAKQAYAVKRWDKEAGRHVMTTQTGIDGFRVVAERTGRYEGQDGPYFCGEDGVWTDVWLKKTPPLAAKVGVFRTGFRQALYRIAKWDEYVQMGKDGPTKFWKNMPCGQLAKCAESLALRSAFPQDLSGVYTAEEMSQAGEPDERGSSEAAQAVAQQKIAAMSKALPAPEPPPVIEAEFVEDVPADPEMALHQEILFALSNSRKKVAFDKFKMLPEIGKLKARLLRFPEGEAIYRRVLERCGGAKKSNEFTDENNGLMARVAYKEISMILMELEASALPPEVAKLPDAIEQVIGTTMRYQGAAWKVVANDGVHQWELVPQV